MLALVLAALPTLTLMLPPTTSVTRCAALTMMPKEFGERVTFIDGDNLMSHRKVTHGREQMCAKISGVRGSTVVVVFDGRIGEEASDTNSDPRVRYLHMRHNCLPKTKPYFAHSALTL
jgi:alanine dehydrogenase